MGTAFVERALRAAPIVLLAAVLAGCGGPDVESRSTGSDGIRVRAFAYRINGPFYAVNVVLLTPQAGRFRIVIVDGDGAAPGPQDTLAASFVDADKAKEAYASFNSNLTATSHLLIRAVDNGQPTGSGKILFSTRFSPSSAVWQSWMLWLTLAGISGIAIYLLIRFWFYSRVKAVESVDILKRENSRSEAVPARLSPSTDRTTKKDLEGLKAEIRSKMAASRQDLQAALDAIDSIHQRTASLEHGLSTEVEGLRNAVETIKAELSRLEQSDLSEAQALDSWARTGVISQDGNGRELTGLKAAASLCRLGNDFVAAPERKSARLEVTSGTAEWVTLERTGDKGNRIIVQRSTKPTPWLSCVVPEDRTRLVVPATRSLSPDDLNVLQLLFRGAETVNPENAETLRTVRPAILPTSGRAEIRKSITAKGRILADNHHLQTSEYLILAMENSLLVAAEAMSSWARSESPSPAEAKPEVSLPKVVAETRENGEMPPLPLGMQALWWESALEQATMDGGTQPEDYAVRVGLAGELIAKALHDVGPGWAQKLAWIRFDFDNDCLVVAEVRPTDAGLAPTGAGRPGPLRGRDLFQVMIVVAHTLTKQELVFIPLGDFLLDNHVTVFNRLLKSPPVAPAYIKRVLRPGIIEKIRGKNYRIVPRGEMVVEVRTEH